MSVVDTVPPPADIPHARQLCAAWLGGASCEVAPLASAGFSGAEVFAVRCGAGRFVLKAIAAGLPEERAAWVHDLMRGLRAAGVETVPPLAETRGGGTLVRDLQGRRWELAGFVVGSAVTAPTPAEAAAATAALARLHAAAATLRPTAPGPAPCFRRRIARAGSLLADPWECLRARLPPAGSGSPLVDGLRERLDRAVETFATAGGRPALGRVARLRPPPLPLQPVLRDVWTDHVLFAPDPPPRVAGFIDFHAAGIDSPATDLARLLGSWPADGMPGGDWLDGWAAALAAYDGVRPLAAGERHALPLLDASGVVFGLDNWFRWVLEERRSFPAVATVMARVDGLLRRLPAAVATLGTIPAD